MNCKSHSIAAALFVLILVGGCSKDDPAPPICYLTGYAEITDVSTYSELLAYDDKNRVISITSAANGATPSTVTFVYGSNGNLATGDFGGGETATYTFDSQNRMIVRTLAPSGATTTFTYNSSGQNILMVYSDPNCASCGHSTAYTYPNTTTHNYGEAQFESVGGAMHTTVYEYDTHPNPYKPVLYSSTGATNNVTKEVFTDNSGSTTTTYTYTYNDKGYPLTATSNFGLTRTYAYNCK